MDDDWRESVRDRLSSAMRSGGWTQRALAEQLGITGSAVAQWMGRDSAFRDWQTLSRVAPLLKVSVDYLLGLTDEPQGHASVPQEVVSLDSEDWPALPIRLEQVGAGGMAVLDVADEPRTQAFRREWLLRTYGTDDPRHVWLFKVAADHKGESMSPTIQPGATCLVGPLLLDQETCRHRIIDGEIHLLYLDEGYVVKRVRCTDHSLIIWSDNPAPQYRPFTLAFDERPLQTIVIGRIKWTSHEL